MYMMAITKKIIMPYLFLIIEYDGGLVKPQKTHVPSKNLLYNFNVYNLIIIYLHRSFFVIRLYINKTTMHKIQ